MQKAIIIKTEDINNGPIGKSTPKENTNELNDLLDKGWHVVTVTPMGITGGGENMVISTALVIIEK